ncbi:MAG: SMI1/KNR4 family protein, partial [Maritimibacter sp.]|nr:SMI1/KNR4 family protein [Maritimibacter sp.]
MPGYEWNSFYSTPEPGETPQGIAAVEAELGVSFPEALRQGYLTTGRASIFKGGKECSVAVTGPVREGGREVGFFQNLEPLAGIVYQVRG